MAWLHKALRAPGVPRPGVDDLLRAAQSEIPLRRSMRRRAAHWPPPHSRASPAGLHPQGSPMGSGCKLAAVHTVRTLQLPCGCPHVAELPARQATPPTRLDTLGRLGWRSGGRPTLALVEAASTWDHEAIPYVKAAVREAMLCVFILRVHDRRRHPTDAPARREARCPGLALVRSGASRRWILPLHQAVACEAGAPFAVRVCCASAPSSRRAPEPPMRRWAPLGASSTCARTIARAWRAGPLNYRCTAITADAADHRRLLQWQPHGHGRELHCCTHTGHCRHGNNH
jgi:hypothetical protein